METSAKPENHENERFSGSPIMNPESYKSQMTQNNSEELAGYSFNKIYNENDTPDPLDPKSIFFPRFSGFSMESKPFFSHDLVIKTLGAEAPDSM